MRFTDRADAGRHLAQRLLGAYGKQAGGVYAIPRGGIVPGAAVADHLNLPLEVVVACRICHPQYAERAIGAVTETGHPVIDRAAVTGVPVEWFERQVILERQEARRRRGRYLGHRPMHRATGELAIIVDDDVVTGLTMIAALRELQVQRPKRLVAAVPIIPAALVARLRQEADDVVTLAEPTSADLDRAATYYESLVAITDDDVIRLLEPRRATESGAV